MHHKDHNHDNNPPDGSNWELLCLYCHDNEHSRQLVLASQGNASKGRDSRPAATHQPLAELLERKSWFAHRGAFHHCLLLRAELDSRFDEQLFHQHGLEINRKTNRHVRRVGGWNALPCCDSGFQNRAHIGTGYSQMNPLDCRHHKLRQIPMVQVSFALHFQTAFPWPNTSTPCAGWRKSSRHSALSSRTYH